jgi:hypothetical protein
MFYDDTIKEYGDINYEINKLYCEKYNLEIIVTNERLQTDRHPAWERLSHILKYIENYDYLIWIDADAFFYNNANDITELISQYENTNINFIFSNDIGNNNVNTGFFIVKNSEYSINFINKWNSDEELYNNNPHPYWWDQGVLIYMIQNNVLDIQSNCIFYKYGILQHFRHNELKTFQIKPYVFHMAGQSNDKRVIISNNYYNHHCIV